MGQSGAAVESYHAALAISGAAHLDALSALAWRVLSTVHQQSGELSEALDAAERSRKLYQGIGDQASEAAAFFSSANAYFRMGQYRRAAEAYEETPTRLLYLRQLWSSETASASLVTGLPLRQNPARPSSKCT